MLLKVNPSKVKLISNLNVNMKKESGKLSHLEEKHSSVLANMITVLFQILSLSHNSRHLCHRIAVTRHPYCSS